MTSSIEARSLERSGLDLLLFGHYENGDVEAVIRNPAWVIIRFANGHEYAIWRNTGAVYRVNTDGAVRDDPFIVPSGSPYDGPMEDA